MYAMAVDMIFLKHFCVSLKGLKSQIFGFST